ncbi:hypothetical protein KSP24_09145 [Paenibacillus sp. AK121]|uniref:hypothetical protein n=1 Tax=Paenibacillus TaxID=44249 RepID=UPI001C21AF63|nr:hypothetical protein [Paenibacillus sp. AK121]MBU9707090.1 hypothetical protein [Paenibacillus sp. AK121]MEE4566410.1 hypothetical protein [Paenibacillus polymyxa]
MDMKDQMKTEKEQNGQATKKGMTLENVWFASKEHGLYPYHINHDLRQSDYFYNKNYTQFHEHDFQSIVLRVSEEPEAFYLTEYDKKYYSTQELEVIEKISK